MGLSNASARKRAIILASLAIVSAILSNFSYLWAPSLLFFNVDLKPGIFFGMVLGLAIRLWVSRRIFEIFAIVLLTVVAWFAAVKTAATAYDSIQHMLAEIAAPGTYVTINFMFAVCGVLGGLVGSTTLTFGLALVCREFGAFENWARIVMPGTALGILLELAEKDDKFALHLGTLLPLFLGWQMTVAAIIGYCIVPRSGTAN
jgi:hypothetical protein